MMLCRGICLEEDYINPYILINHQGNVPLSTQWVSLHSTGTDMLKQRPGEVVPLR